MSVRRVHAEIDAAEFAEWRAYYALEPWGEERGDLRAGIIASVVANVAPGRGKKAFLPADFMPDYAKPPRRPTMTAMHMQAVLRLTTKLAGGTVQSSVPAEG